MNWGTFDRKAISRRSLSLFNIQNLKYQDKDKINLSRKKLNNIFFLPTEVEFVPIRFMNFRFIVITLITINGDTTE